MNRDQIITILQPSVEKAIPKFGDAKWFSPVLISARNVWKNLSNEPFPLAEFRSALRKTTEPDEHSVERITGWLATALLSASVEAGHDGELEWVTRHDDHVRPTHAACDGQKRKKGEKFTVGDAKLSRPGDPEGPLDEVMGCRCTLRRVTVTAAGHPEANTSSVIVALPAEDDPIHGIGDEQKHATLIFMGPADQISATGENAIRSYLQELATQLTPFEEPVSGRGTLGSEGANVLFLEGHTLPAIRDQLAQYDGIAEAMSMTPQHPNYIPHTTLNYGEDAPPESTDVSSIRFDRLALWHGETQTEYPMGADMTEPDMETPEEEKKDMMPDLIPWHGVLAPEGVPSGDGRMFAHGSLRNRPLPMPLSWQKVSQEQHYGSVVIGRIDSIERGDDGLMHANGVFLATPEADEFIGILAEFGKFGVSVDVDDATFDLAEDQQSLTFTDARISAASAVSIPAYAEAYIALGPAPEPITAAISESAWDGSASRFTDEEWARSCILDMGAEHEGKSRYKLPIKEPNGDLSRAGVHAAASRISQVDAPASAISAAKGRLRSAYKQLGEDAPFSADTFNRGPGWVTNPEATKRIHDYWTKPGEEGFDKIGWGTEGAFNRCRTLVGEEIAENSPDKTRFLNQICAQWYHDAIGVWPGKKRGDKHALEGDTAPAITLVASSGWCPPSEWFTEPDWTGDELMVNLTEHNGHYRVFGYVAEWGVCHIGLPACTVAPHSAIDYLGIKQGSVELDSGDVIRCGVLSLGGGHASHDLGVRGALAHYDSTSTAIARVTFGENDRGVWYSGAVRNDATPDQIAELRAARVSGDWRDIGGNLELIAALAVNVPGFNPARARYAEGHTVALVAAGMFGPTTETGKVDLTMHIDVDKFASKIADELEDRAKRRKRLAELAAAVRTVHD